MITCRACGTEERVFVDHPALLCAACLSDLRGTAQRLTDEYAAAMVRYFDAARALGMRAKDSEWFAKTERAREDMTLDPALFARAWEVARAEGGEKRVLIELREAMDAAAEHMRTCELRHIAAAPELAHARAVFGEPIEV